MNILFICDNNYQILKEYYNSFIIKFDIIIQNLPDEETFIKNYSDSNKYIFAIRNIPPYFMKYIELFKNNIYIFNFDQNCRKDMVCSRRFENFPDKINILEFSRENIKYYNTRKNIYFIPYNINYSEIKNYEKKYMMCSIYSTSKYRNNIINILKNNNISVDIIAGFATARDEILFKYKILLNLNFDDNCKIIESIRIDRCIFNKMIILSDEKYDCETYHLKNYIIFFNKNNMLEIINAVLNNYENYYSKIFNDFNLANIQKDIDILQTDALNEFKKQ